MGKQEQINELMQQREELQKQRNELLAKATALKQEMANEMFEQHKELVYTTETIHGENVYLFPQRAYINTHDDFVIDFEQVTCTDTYFERESDIHIAARNVKNPIPKQKAKAEILEHIAKIAKIRIQEAIDETSIEIRSKRH